jgi:plasmid rolling circle replication initiator protein Rep
MTRLSPEFQSILEKYKNHKIDTYKVAELLGSDYTFNNYGADEHSERYSQLINCGTFLQFTKDENNIYHLKGANFCRQRVCPMCQFRKAEKTFAQTLKVVKGIEQRYRFLHLVLTIPNPKYEFELVEAVKILYGGFNRFLKYKDIKRAFKGVLRCLEVSYNYNESTFHPHLHCLVAVNYSYFNDSKVYLSYDRLRQLWTKAVNADLSKRGKQADFARTDCLLQINIRSCKHGDYVGVAEVCKYCVKPLDFNGDTEQYKRLLLSLMSTLKGTRFIQKYGVVKEEFKKLGLDEVELESLEQDKRLISFTWSPDNLNFREVYNED